LFVDFTPISFFQHESGADLAMLLLEIMKNASLPVDSDSVGELIIHYGVWAWAMALCTVRNVNG
jgi:hypothetical protein